MIAQMEAEAAELNKELLEAAAPEKEITEAENKEVTPEEIETTEPSEDDAEEIEEVAVEDIDKVQQVESTATPTNATPTESKAQQRFTEKKRREAAELEAARLKGQIDILTRQQEAKPAIAEPVNADPEPDRDSFEHTEWLTRQTANQLNELKKELEFTKAEKLWADTDRQLTEKATGYKSSMDFLRNSHRDILKAQMPNASSYEIDAEARRQEYQVVGSLYNPNLSPEQQELVISSYFVGLAMKNGHNPYADIAPKLVKQPTTPQRPVTNQREVTAHKRNAGSIVGTAGESGRQFLSSDDLAEMSVWEAAKIPPRDWEIMKKETRL